MSAFRNSGQGPWLPQGVALLLLGAMLLGVQVAETAHAEVECEHESCSLCAGSPANDALTGDSNLPGTPGCGQRIHVPAFTHLQLSFQTLAHLIRGPPAP